MIALNWFPTAIALGGILLSVEGFSTHIRLPLRSLNVQQIPKQSPIAFDAIVRDTRHLSESIGLLASTSATLFGRQSSTSTITKTKTMSKVAAFFTKMGMVSFIVSMCLALPVVLLPQALLHRLGLISRVKQQQLALSSGQICARWLLRLIPFCNVTVKSIKFDSNDQRNVQNSTQEPQPSIWVCNHASALDVFILLAKDLELRGEGKRPLKIVYWKGLEENPITKLLFQQCGFIPVEMAANAAGEANDYDMKSFRNLLKMTKQAFEEGFDIGILPEGQLNPDPEKGLLPCFSGAFTLAKMSKRPIQMMALHGTHRLWHAREDIGMTVTGRDVAVQIYHHPVSVDGEASVGSGGRRYDSSDEFLATFQAVVGEFATTGKDLDDDDLRAWLDGSKWRSLKEENSEGKQPAEGVETIASSNDTL
ncbi:acyltransferase [Nitzschia inconspicua]|uniref:Acyltransferase n=1 Tax=Nitzschia inconspicua TaxID=303405 RepID=A0A9K3LH57_9STRA|nr:acyltransferase [Nitzschia inconspicua]